MLNKQIAVRVTGKFHKQWTRKTKPYGRSSDVLRELLEAFVEDRLNITPNPNKEKI